MTWISLICLLALSSSAFGRTVPYGGGYGGASVQQAPKILSVMRDQTIQNPVKPFVPQGYGQQSLATAYSAPLVQQQQQQDQSGQQSFQGAYGTSLNTPVFTQKTLPIQNYGQGFDSVITQKTLPIQGYGAVPFISQMDQQSIPQTLPLTPADTLCRGQQPETVIPLQDGRSFVVCLDDSKGVEQQCPKGLYYHAQSLRCERKLGPLENACALQPCLNGGQCIATDSSYQCQCAAGFDGKICELDARICQTQQPCGQAPDTKCQSFRWGAALQYICIFQDGLAYGLSTTQVQPSPCHDIDGPQALLVSINGFIMCDGERLFVESCPGGTVWDDVNKACVWPDMQTTQQDQSSTYGQSSYGQSSYGQSSYGQSPYGAQSSIQQSKALSPYGTQIAAPQQQFDLGQTAQSGYGASINVQQPRAFSVKSIQPKVMQSGYGAQIAVPQQQFDLGQTAQSGYGASINVQQPRAFSVKSIQPKVSQSGYGAQIAVPQQQFDLGQTAQSGYGAQIAVPQQQLDLGQTAQSGYGAQIAVPQQQFDLGQTAQSGYGASISVQQPKSLNIMSSQPKVFQSGYGVPQQQQQQQQQQLDLSQTAQSGYGAPKIFQQPKVIQSSYGSQQPQQDQFVSVGQSSGY